MSPPRGGCLLPAVLQVPLLPALRSEEALGMESEALLQLRPPSPIGVTPLWPLGAGKPAAW
ncbi:MAG: hypothetical protein ACT6SG_20385 [Hydrogenophaga sp.]